MKTPLGIIATIDNAISTGAYSKVLKILPNPDPVLRKTGKALSAYREIQGDTTVKTAFQSRKAKVLRRELKVNHDKEKTVQSAFIEKMFAKLNVQKIISEMLDARAFGYQPMEVYYRVINEYVHVTDIVGKPQEWFVCDSQKQWRFLTTGNKNGEMLPHQKFVIVQSEDTYTNPYGHPLLSDVYWSVTFKRGGLKMYLAFLEKYGLPYLHGKVRRNSKEDVIEELFTALEDLRQDGVVVTEDDKEINIVDASGSRSSDLFKQLREDMRADIIEPIVGHRSLVEATPGKLGSEDTALDVIGALVDSDVALVESYLNKIVRWVVDMNFFVTEYPTISLVERIGLNNERANRDAIISEKLGVKFTKAYVQRYYDLKDDEFDIAETSAQGAPTTAGFANTNDEVTHNHADDSVTPPDQAAVDVGVAKLVSDPDANTAMEKMLEPIYNLIKNSSSYEELQSAITELFPAMNTDELEQMLAHAIWASDTIGRITA